jgi:hypothetical protein
LFLQYPSLVLEIMHMLKPPLALRLQLLLQLAETILTQIPGLTTIAQAGDLPGLFNELYKICIGVSATLAFLIIIWAGVMYMGGDSVTETKRAKEMIANALLGLVVVLSPYIVFSIVNPNILKFNINFSSTGASAPATAATAPAAATSATTNVCTNAAANGQAPYVIATSETLTPSPTICQSIKAGVAAKQYKQVSASCCANISGSSVCCGNTGYVPATPLAGASTFNYIVVHIDYNRQCYVNKAAQFTSLSTCQTGLQAADKQPYTYTSQDCNGTTYKPAQLQSLPSC